MKKQNIKLYQSAYNVFSLRLFTNSDGKINISPHFTFSLLTSQAIGNIVNGILVATYVRCQMGSRLAGVITL